LPFLTYLVYVLRMLTRSQSEELEKKLLAPFAVKSGESEGRLFTEEEHPSRTRFQRDRDRVVHSRAFRRLMYKTQVFVNHEGDYYRTRLTHSLEVAQIARSIARMLRLNEDLTETVSLAHDLGHTPFGHSGQDVMNVLMKEYGGFEHNRQSFRVVTLLEDRYPKFLGLNVTVEVLEGIAKHASEYDMPQGIKFRKKGYPTLEAQVCNLADEIAYNNHDIDDGLKSGMLELSQMADVEIWANHFEKVRKKYNTVSVSVQIAQTVKCIINTLVMDLVEQTQKNIEENSIHSVDDVRSKGKGIVSFSPIIRKQSAELKKFLMKNLYRHYRVTRMADKAERIMKELFRAYIHNPRIMPPDFSQRYECPEDARLTPLQGEQTERIVCDYIAGMTDRFALDEYKKLFDPHERV